MGYLLNKNSNRGKKAIITMLIFSTLVLAALPLVYSKVVHAAPFTEASIRLDRMGADVAANNTDAKILVTFKPASSASEANIVITWPTSNAFTVSSTAGDHTVTDTGIPSTYQGESLSASGITSPATDVTGGAVTFTIPDVTAGTLYGFFITGGITNPSATDAGTHTINIATTDSSDSEIDATDVAVNTVGTGEDQVSVSASVPATFTFDIQDNALALGELSTGSVSNDSMGTPIDVSTNAQNGWTAWIRSEGAGRALSSSTTGYDIQSTDTGSTVTCSSGTDCYVIDADASAGGSSTGTVSEDSEYAGDGSTSGGVISTSYEEIATSDGPASNDSITLTAIAAISGVVPAASDYADTLEVVGAGNF